jgi:ribose transport system substrate-binding protein
MSRTRCLTLAALAAVALAGCGPSKPPAKYRVVVIPKGLTHEHWVSVHRGADRAAADLAAGGVTVEVVWDGPRKESDALEQINIVNRHVAGKISGIVLAPQHSKQMVDPVRRAADQKIPVVVIDSGLDDPALMIKYVATDNYNGGRLAAQRLLKVMAGDGKAAPKIVMIRYAPGSESTEQREKGFEDVIDAENAARRKDGKPEVVWLSKDKYAGATKDTAIQAALPLLNGLKDGGIDGIFAPNESSAAGVLEAMRSLSLNKKVRLVGFDASPPLLQALRDGDLDGTIVQDPYRMGYFGVWAVVQHLEGFDVAPAGETVLSTGETLVTRDNVDTDEVKGLFDKDAQAQRSIPTPKLARRP